MELASVILRNLWRLPRKGQEILRILQSVPKLRKPIIKSVHAILHHDRSGLYISNGFITSGLGFRI